MMKKIENDLENKLSVPPFKTQNFSKQFTINVEQKIKLQETKNTWNMQKIILFSLGFIILIGLFIRATGVLPKKSNEITAIPEATITSVPNTTATPIPQSIIYENAKYNFTLTVPHNWEGKYEVADTMIQSANVENFDFINKANKAYGGVLFTITIWSTEKWNTDGIDAANHIQISKIGESGGKVFSLSTPSDVEFSLDDARLKEEYNSMWDDIKTIKTTFAIKTPSLNTGVPRAIGISEFGELRIEPQFRESIHKLGAPSCYGLEDDNSITADYNVMFKTKSGITNIQTLKSIEIINPKDVTLQIKKIKLGDTELFYFVPRYTDCHSLEFYLYGIDETGAYPITYSVDNKIIHNFEMHPKEEPKIINDRLVFKGGVGAGMDTVSEYYFQFDKKNHLMKLEKTLQVKPF